MYEALYRYLLNSRKLDLPGIGVIAVETRPAVSDFVNHSFLPPQQSFRFSAGDEVPPESLFAWLAAHFRITEQEAVIRFNEFILHLSRLLREGKEVLWPRIGGIHKEVSGEILFQPDQRPLYRYPAVTARKVIRENVEHTMLVGERETTSTFMKELLAPALVTRRSNWWVWPIAVLLACVIFLGLYFSMDGNDRSAGNRHKITPANPPAGFSFQP